MWTLSFGISLRILICIAIAAAFVYAYIDNQNELIAVQLAIPAIAKELKAIQEENVRLEYQIDCFESPLHLMELVKKPEFSYLKFPGQGGAPTSFDRIFQVKIQH